MTDSPNMNVSEFPSLFDPWSTGTLDMQSHYDFLFVRKNDDQFAATDVQTAQACHSYSDTLSGLSVYNSPLTSPEDMINATEFPFLNKVSCNPHVDNTMPQFATEDSLKLCLAQSQSQKSRRKEQNRSAQRAYRERQRSLISTLEAEIHTWKTTSAQLRARNETLERELIQLQREMLLYLEPVRNMPSITTGRMK